MIFFAIPVLNDDSDKSSRTEFFVSYIMMLSLCFLINLILKLFNSYYSENDII